MRKRDIRLTLDAPVLERLNRVAERFGPGSRSRVASACLSYALDRLEKDLERKRPSPVLASVALFVEQK